MQTLMWMPMGSPYYRLSLTLSHFVLAHSQAGRGRLNWLTNTKMGPIQPFCVISFPSLSPLKGPHKIISCACLFWGSEPNKPVSISSFGLFEDQLVQS
jgi:hypothetical protein